MILDKLCHAHRYFGMHPLFKLGFSYLQDAILKPFQPGRYELAGPDLIAIVEEGQGRTKLGAPLEAHRKYIDIQCCFAGNEEIGWKAYGACQSIKDPYNSDRDIEFFSDTPTLWLPVPAHSFSILFPEEDAHAPLAGEGHVQKIILKVLAQ